MANVHGISHGGGGNKNPYARPPQAAGIVEPAINHEAVKQVTSEKALDAALKAAAARLTVVHFYCPWFPPSHKMAVVVARLSVKYPNVQFLRLDAEALPGVAGNDRYRVNGMPYFIFFKKQSIEDRKETDSEEWLEGTIMRLTGGRAIVAGAGNRLGDKSDADAGTNAAIEALQAMGFSEGQARKGLAAAHNNVEMAAAYLLDHPEVDGGVGEGAAVGGAAASVSEVSADPNAPHVHNALCNRCKRQIRGIRYKCKGCADFDLCGSCFPQRVMWHDEEHEFAEHATELEVAQSEPKSNLTDEQKAAEVQRLKELMEAKRQMREEDAKRAERELEMKRRVEAKNTQEHKRKWEEQKIAMEAEKVRRQKEKEEQHKQAVLEKIRREKGEKQGTIAPAPVATAPRQVRPFYGSVFFLLYTVFFRKEPTECVIQIRAAGGAVLTWRGSPDATLRDVAAWLGQQPGYGAVRAAFATTHPRQLFQGDSLGTSLKQAGLVPRGVLVLEK